MGKKQDEVEEEEDEGPRLLIYSSKSRVRRPQEFVKLEILIKTVNHTFLFVQRQSAKEKCLQVIHGCCILDR